MCAFEHERFLYKLKPFTEYLYNLFGSNLIGVCTQEKIIKYF